MSEKDPRWQRYGALGMTVLAIACAVIFRARLAADFWPPDRSFVGPNLLAAIVQAALVLIVLALIWPPARRSVHRFMDRKLRGLHDRHDQHSEHLERIGRSLAELHERLDAQARPTGGEPDGP